jgi:hypothetical protein
MQNWRAEPTETTAEHMICQLADACNGAATHDSSGFSKIDVAFGHSLAERAKSGRPWTSKQAAGALKLIRRYQRQLGGRDVISQWITYPNFANMPVDATPARPNRKLFSEEKTALFQFDFDRDILSAVKQIRGSHKGEKFWASWDAARKTWRVPVNESSILQIIKVAQAWEFEVEERFEIYHNRVTSKLAHVMEAAKESQVGTALGMEPGVCVTEDHIEVVHGDPMVLAQFKEMLNALV